MQTGAERYKKLSRSTWTSTWLVWNLQNKTKWEEISPRSFLKMNQVSPTYVFIFEINLYYSDSWQSRNVSFSQRMSGRSQAYTTFLFFGFSLLCSSATVQGQWTLVQSSFIVHGVSGCHWTPKPTAVQVPCMEWCSRCTEPIQVSHVFWIISRLPNISTTA